MTPHILLQKSAGGPNRNQGQPALVPTSCSAAPTLPAVGSLAPSPPWAALPPFSAGSSRENANLEAKPMSTFQKPLLWVPFILSFFPGHHLCSWAPTLEQAPGSRPQQE